MQLRDFQIDISTRASLLLRNYGVAYLSMECRTGKTLTALATAEKFHAQRVLFVTKRKAIPSVESDYQMLSPSFRMETTTHDSVHKCEADYDLVIVDEAHAIGAFPKPSKRAKELKSVCKKAAVLLLSGTPSPESYSQLYHQFWICAKSPWAKYANFYKWAKYYVIKSERKINGYTVTDYSSARKDLIDADTRHLFIDFSQKEAGFSCNIEEEIRVIPASEYTRNLIGILKRDRVAYLSDGSAILGDTPVKLMGKLHQLSSGTVITEDGGRVITDYFKAQYIWNNFKGQKTAIFYVYQSEADMLKKVFHNWTDSPEVFQAQDDRVFIGQVRSAREGVRLDSADVLIFLNLEYSFLSYEQGRNRLSSKEREKPVRVCFLCSDCGIESKILEAVHNKEDFTYSYYKNR